MSDEHRRLLREAPAHAVTIHVYDLTQGVNDYAYHVGLGLFHSSVEVHGYEWAYGGHNIAGHSGIYAMRAASMPREPGARVGNKDQCYTYRTSYPAGSTNLTKADVERIIRDMGRDMYEGVSYHILQNNCNNFTDAFCRELTGVGAPRWINRLANIAVSLHCLVPAGFLPELIEERGRQAAGRMCSMPPE